MLCFHMKFCSMVDFYDCFVKPLGHIGERVNEVYVT